MKTNKWLVYTALFVVSLTASQATEIPFVPSIDQIQYPVKEDILEIGVPEELANPNIFFPEVKRVIPVVIVSFLHAQPDGIHGNNVNLNLSKRQDGRYRFFDGRLINSPKNNPLNKTLKLKLSELSNWHLYSYIKGKFAVEESTRFRGYIDANSVPYIGIKVIKHFNVYKNFIDSDKVNHHKLFKKIGLQELVEKHGVKEVWISTQKGGVPESNMSSPVTRDISNSWRHQDDLPIYNKTYVVYAFPPHRNYDVFLHCRAHQYERMLSFINKKFFVREFVGYGKLIAGNCHHPVNTAKKPDGKWKHYDYSNTQLTSSVIETWIPYTKTPTKIVNASYWGSKVKHLPKHINLPVATQLNWWRRAQSSGYTVGGGWCNKKNKQVCFDSVHASWLIMWSQQFPGIKPIKFRKPNNSSVAYETINWWDIIYDWDDHAALKLQASKDMSKDYFGLYVKKNN